MVVEFTKMSGAGNDFVLMDNRKGALNIDPAQAAQLCDRHRGIGADGLILLKRCESGKADWAWDFFNSDGSLAAMCGNGARCFGRYVARLTGATKGFTFETRAGIIQARLQGDEVTVNLTAPKNMRLHQNVVLTGGPAVIHSLDTGVPHAVMFVPDADKAMVQHVGAEIRHHLHFAPHGTNANFVQLLDDGGIRVRTYERGVEGETLACGTGVTASAIITAELHSLKPPITVRVQDGRKLKVDFEKQGDQVVNVALTGPADFIFEGKIDLAAMPAKKSGASS